MPAIPALRVRLGVLALLASAALAPVRAGASGIYIPENGTEVLSEGGADVGLLDTAYSLQFNPAGMAFVNGLDVHLDMNITNPGESFTDQGASKVVANGASTKVSNTGGLSLGPQVMAVYHPPNFHWLAFGLGVWGPPGVINYSFPDPRPACCSATATTAQVNAATAGSPQRYEVISQSTLVIYPTLGLAVRPIPQIAFGATLQYVIADIQLATALQGLPSEFSSNPNSVTNDVVASVNTTGKPRFTTTLGLVISPIQNLMISGSFQPMIPIDTSGTLGLELGSQVSSLGVSVAPTTPTANLEIKLPPVVRAGISYKWQRLTSSVEYVWEGWSVNNAYTLSTNAQVKSLLGNMAVGTIQIPNNWTDTSSVRVGFGYDFFRPERDGFGLHGNLGFLWDENAIPQDWQKVPFVTGTTLGPTIGAGASWHGVGLNVGFAYYIPQSFTVTQSQVAKPVTPAPGQTSAPAPIYIGDGTYTTNVWVFSVGLSYSGFGA